MTIRLTSVESFEKVLERLKQFPMYDEETFSTFLKYAVPRIRKGLESGANEWFLNLDWLPIPENSRYGRYGAVITYHTTSYMISDVDFLKKGGFEE